MPIKFPGEALRQMIHYPENKIAVAVLASSVLAACFNENGFFDNALIDIIGLAAFLKIFASFMYWGGYIRSEED